MNCQLDFGVTITIMMTVANRMFTVVYQLRIRG